MKLAKLLLLASLTMMVVAHAQVPNLVQMPPILYHHAAQNTDGTNFTADSNDAAAPADWTFTVTNNLRPGWWTIFKTGRKIGKYTSTNLWGAQPSLVWTPKPAAPVITVVCCGGVPFLYHTNTDGGPSVRFFTSKPTGRTNLWDILDSTNYHDFRDAFTFVTATNGQLTITQ